MKLSKGGFPDPNMPQTCVSKSRLEPKLSSGPHLFIIHTVLHHGIVDDDKETICIHDITEFKLKMEHLIAVNTRVSLEMRAVGIVVTHNTFMYLLAVLIIAISSWKLFSFLLVNLLLKPNKNMVGICRRWLKSLFQIADNTDGR